MRVIVFSTHGFEKEFLLKANNQKHELVFVESRLSMETVHLANGFDAVSLFVNDKADSQVVEQLQNLNIKCIVLRSAGFNHVDFRKARSLGMRVARVPLYSPFAVAEHAVTLMMVLNRNIIRAHNRINDLNFSLDGLTGFDMRGKTIGIIGTGNIGGVTAEILHGFGCKLLGYDTLENEELKKKVEIRYTSLKELCANSDIISLHCPLNENTKYIINENSIQLMKKGVMLINTSRGGLINTRDVINALKVGQIGYFGMDVYEEEEQLFFADHSQDILQDEAIARLLSFRNVLITGHQAFLTREALEGIAGTTIANLDCFEKGIECHSEILD